MTDKPGTVILTGASGFIGRYLLDELKTHSRVFAIARRSQSACNAPVHPNIAWLRADLTDPQSLTQAFREITTAGGADYFIHLAAYYEFSEAYHPCYLRTNVEGTRRVLEFAKTLPLKRFVFSSSVAASAFPPRGTFLNEKSPPDGEHIYAWSKREGERLVSEYSSLFPTTTVRFGAVFSDWCEYAPLYVFLNTWLGASIRARMLAGAGESAIPYIHIRDITSFFRRLFLCEHRLASGQTLIASTNGSTSHRTLFSLATKNYFGKALSPILMPSLLCGLGLHAMNAFGKVTKRMPFERPWMYKYIDKQLNVDNSATSSLLDWTPDARNLIERRLPFLVERLKSEPQAWHARNLVSMQRDPARPEYVLFMLLSNNEDLVLAEVMKVVKEAQHRFIVPMLEKFGIPEMTWLMRLLYRLLVSSIQLSNRLLVQNYFEISARNRFEAGFAAPDLVALVRILHDMIVFQLKQERAAMSLDKEIYDYVTMPVEFAVDEIEHQHELFINDDHLVPELRHTVPEGSETARKQLEETIWTCLSQRK